MEDLERRRILFEELKSDEEEDLKLSCQLKLCLISISFQNFMTISTSPIGKLAYAAQETIKDSLKWKIDAQAMPLYMLLW